MPFPLFQRPHHNAIAKVLSCLDGVLLCQAQCFFGGGTAIVLGLGEYRESIDIDFLCAAQDGYRRLRRAVWDKGLDGLLAPGALLHTLRDLQADQYGIRTMLKIDDLPIRFEIVREARIPLDGALDARLGVPVLVRPDMYAEKLLANADRWADRAVLSRDIIDLSMMIARWGPIPEVAWQKARQAYDMTVDDAYARAVKRIRDPDWLRTCLEKMAMDPSLADEILSLHGGPSTSAD